MQEKQSLNKYFLPVVLAFYAAAVLLSYIRIYVLQAYPTYYSEDDMPGALDTLTDIPSLLTPTPTP